MHNPLHEGREVWTQCHNSLHNSFQCISTVLLYCTALSPFEHHTVCTHTRTYTSLIYRPSPSISEPWWQALWLCHAYSHAHTLPTLWIYALHPFLFKWQKQQIQFNMTIRSCSPRAPICSGPDTVSSVPTPLGVHSDTFRSCLFFSLVRRESVREKERGVVPLEETRESVGENRPVCPPDRVPALPLLWTSKDTSSGWVRGLLCCECITPAERS